MKRLVLFAKAPRVGLVKTRLARSIGEAEALKAYQALVQNVLRALVRFRDVTVQFSPDDAQSDVASWMKPGWTSAPQGSAGLGDRLARCFEEQFSHGAERVVVIGSDCPDIDGSDIEDAWESLKTHDLVLGPAADGGYWLIGLSRNCPSVFTGVDWGTERVLEQTVARAKHEGLSIALLRQLSDVDTAEDWEAFKRGTDVETELVSGHLPQPVSERS